MPNCLPEDKPFVGLPEKYLLRGQDLTLTNDSPEANRDDKVAGLPNSSPVAGPIYNLLAPKYKARDMPYGRGHESNMLPPGFVPETELDRAGRPVTGSHLSRTPPPRRFPNSLTDFRWNRLESFTVSPRWARDSRTIHCLSEFSRIVPNFSTGLRFR
jgi:hypothetical protein